MKLVLESIRYDSPLLKAIGANKNLDISSLQKEQDDFKFWFDLARKLNISTEKINKIFSKASNADDLAKEIFLIAGDTEEYKELFAESLNEDKKKILYGVRIWFNLKAYYDVIAFESRSNALAFIKKYSDAYQAWAKKYQNYEDKGINDDEVEDALVAYIQPIIDSVDSENNQYEVYDKEFEKDNTNAIYLDTELYRIKIVDDLEYGA